jgi:hypothetical protein
MDFRTDEEIMIDNLEARVSLLEEAVKLLAANCKCSPKERFSGHLSDCTAPHVIQMLDQDTYVDTPRIGN